jgi:hydrogenase large subunit
MNQFRKEWLETMWLGCSIDRYLQIKTYDDLMAWVEENDSQRNSDLGLFIRAGLQFGLDKFGQGVGKFIATGTYLHKDNYNHPTIEGRNAALISRSGFYDGKKYHEFDHLNVKEHVSHSWYQDVPAAHPWNEPLPTPLQSQNLHNTDVNGKYSWAKAPRYMDYAAEAGPLSRAIMNANPNNLGKHQIYDPLFGDVMDKMGPSVFTRCLARVHEAPRLYNLIDEWLRQVDLNGEFYIKPEERDGKGFGATEAARGSLSHWVEIENGVIKNYQVMAPTTWNVGPNDDKGNAGPIETALTGIEVADAHDPVEVGIVARSFDSCLVCTVHAHDAKTGEKLAQFKL